MIRFMPADVYDVAAYQAWLEDLAAKGWYPSSLRGHFYLGFFEKGEPKAVRYRLEPAPRTEDYPDADHWNLYRALGWEYAATVAKTMHVWRCDDPGVPELHTDPETEARAYDRLARQEKIGMLAALAVLLLTAGVYAWFFRLSGGGSLEAQVRSWTPLWQVLAALGFGVWLIFLAVRQSTKLRRYLKTLRAGVPAERRRPYRLSCAGSAAMGLLWLSYLSALLANVLEPNSRPFEPVDAFDEPVPHVAIVSEEDVKAIRWTNWLTSEQWWTIEDHTEGRRYYRYSEARYYRLRFPWLADNLVESILAEYGDEYAPTETEYPGLDEVWTGTTVNGNQYLLLRLGDQVWSVEAETDAPLTDLLPQYAAVLAEFQ